MTKKVAGRANDLRGVARLTIAGIVGIVDLVEAMHYSIASVPAMRSTRRGDRTKGITRIVYRGVHGVVGLVGRGLDRLLAQLEPILGEQNHWPGREALLAALNGVLGDYLAASNKPLAIDDAPAPRRHCLADGSRARLPPPFRMPGSKLSCCCTACA